MKLQTIALSVASCILLVACSAGKKDSYQKSVKKHTKKKVLKHKIKDVSHVVHVSHHKHAQGVKV